MEEETPAIEKTDNNEKQENKISKKDMYLIGAILVIAVIVVASVIYILIQTPIPEEVTKIQYENVIYTFSHDIYDSDKITIENKYEIIALMQSENGIRIVFNDTENPINDVPYFKTTGINLAERVSAYYVYTKSQVFLWGITQPLSNTTLDEPTVLIRGPESGANATSVSLFNENTILVQGLTPKELEMAGDKLLLEFIGINFVNPNFTILTD